MKVYIMNSNQIILIIALITSGWLYGYELQLPDYAMTQTATDIDHDGDQDVIVGFARYNQNPKIALMIFKNDGLGNFAAADTLYDSGGSYVKVGFINNNTEEDIVYAAWDSSNLKLLYKVVYDYRITGWSNIGELNFCTEETSSSKEQFELYYRTPNSPADVMFTICSSIDKNYWGHFINDGSGNFNKARRHNINPYTDGFITQLTSGDLDMDGKNDVFVGTNYQKKLHAWMSVDSGLVFRDLLDSTYMDSVQINIARILDIDNDGVNELTGFYKAPMGANKVMVYDRQPNGRYKKTFAKLTNSWIYNWITADFNNDGLAEFVDSGDYYSWDNYSQFWIMQNDRGIFPNAPATFNSGWSSHSPYSADFDGDGWNDIAILNFVRIPRSCLLRIYFNNQQGGFSENPLGIENSSEHPVTDYKLQNYPNPFNNTTVINYDLPAATLVKLAVYNAKGELVKTLINAWQGKGLHSTDFNANGLNSGVYFVKLSGEKMNVNKKILLIK